MSPPLVVEADGGSRGNPGPAGYGAVVRDPQTGSVLAERSEAIGRATNNVAEYRGLLAGLAAARELGATALDVRMDSKLVVEQMSGRWKVRHPDLRPLASRAAALAREIGTVRYTWIPREQNTHADRLANEAMDAAATGRSPAPGAARTPGAAQSGPAGRDRATGWSGAVGTPTTTVLVRHGQTALSVQRRFSGRGDPALTTTGRDQADRLARRLAALPGVAAVVTSPLRRARQTAEVVAARLGCPLTCEPDLVETDFGAWEGSTFAEIRQRWPAELDRWLGSPDVAPPAGESFAATAGRVRRALDRLRSAYAERTVVVVSHVTPIKTLLRVALDAPSSALFRLHLDPVGVSVVDWYADGPAVVRRVNDTAHLE